MTVSGDKDAISRLTDSAETAMYEGDGACLLRFYQPDGTTSLYRFSTKFEADGITFEEPNDQMFSFNSPIGACPECEGFGRVVGIDEHLVIPNRSLSVYDGAVVCWRGEKMGEWKDMVIRGAEKAGFPIFTPYYQLTDEQRRMLWDGTRYFEGINAFFKMLQENQYKIQYRVMLARYRGKTLCPKCHGTRLKPEAGYVRVGGRSISELVDLPITELKVFFDNLKLDKHDTDVARRILIEINNRIRFLLDVGLGYLTLNRLSNSLSGGESQRINLATSLGSSLVGSLYILDEPSIGLHSRDTDKLIHVLRQLQQLGNTVVVVEHDEEIIRAADYIIDIGPKAGRLGGEVVYCGDMKDLQKDSNSYTVRYLLGEETIPVPESRRPWNQYIEITGARENNLKGVDVRFPLNVMTVVTGVSGSGKSTLVRDIFFRALKRELDECTDRPGEFASISGDLRNLRNVEFVDQNPIGKSSRSNPVTYYPEMKQLIANLKEYGFEVWILTASPEFLYQKFLAEELGLPDTQILGVKSVVANGRLTDEIIMPIPQDDGKANVIPTFIKARPLIVGGNSRGDMDMLNQSCGLKIVVNPDDTTIRGKEDGPMNGYTVKQYWEKEGAVIVKCNDIPNPEIKFHTESWKIRTNKSNPQ